MKSGKYIIGLSNPLSMAKFEETLYKIPPSEDCHLTLIHNVVNRSRMSFIGADTVGEVASGLEPRINDPIPSACNFYASLERVVCAQVFSDNESSKCRGILLEYEDGVKRTLGQCRLGFDAVRSYEHPTAFCYLTNSYRRVKHLAYENTDVYVAFDFDTGLFEVKDAAKWEIHPMKGTLQLAYTTSQTVLKIHNA